MGSVRIFLSALVAMLAILSASGWSSPAGACLYDSTSNVVGGAPGAMPAHHWQQHRVASHHQPPAAPVPPPGGARLDCAACIAVLPEFPMFGSHELMPFVPVVQSFEPLSGIEPGLDPPPPRGAGR